MTFSTAHLRSRLLCGTALTLFASLPAMAQDANVDTIVKTYTLDPIVVRKQDPLGDAADRATSAYVSEAELERAAMGDVKDLFAGIASVSVGGAIPIAQKIYVNGIDMLNLAVQVDGVSQNNRIFHHLSANAFDPGLMKSVRVDPGVAPADAGPRALAGRVVLETVDAEDILEDGQTFGGRTRLSYDSNGDTSQGSLTLAGRSNGFEILGYAKRANGDDYKDGHDEDMIGTGANLSASLLKFGYESTQGHRVELSAQRVEDNELRQSQPNFGPRGGDLYEYQTTRDVISLRYENVNDTGLWDPSATVGYSSTDVDRPDDPWGDATQAKSSTVSVVLQNDFHLSDTNTISAGVDYQRRKSSVSGTWVTPDAATEKSENTGVFVQARLEPTDRLTLSAGARYDWQDFTGYTWLPTDAQYKASNNGASGNISAVYDVTDSLALRAGYSSVFGGLDLGDNFEFWRTRDYSDLRASRAQNIVVGADWTPGDWVLSGEVFRTRLKDARDGESNADFESKGVNLGATYNWAGGSARLTYAYSSGKVDGKRASGYDMRDYGVPMGHVIALEAQQELASYNMLVGGSVQAAADYDPGGNYADQEIAGYTVVNVFAEYTPPAFQNVTIRGSINNLFDQTYADRATYGGEFDGFTTIKEPGRNLSVVATVKF